ncbi:MAG: DUF1016 domain-containing protein [Candidatus Magasanikbacteria bacterium]|jgi:predicted nuclease of restriction endonuclease-like (RecB) superfamily|nr:DUF1016 domain-containing protein [Candidatus Magasanikbacteria bacterium]
MSKLVNNNGYKKLVFCITDILEFGRKKVYLQVNDVLAKTYWNVGKQIVEYEQKGYKKAEYGFGVLKNLSKDLTQKFGRGFSVDNLENMRKFYIVYPISETLSRKSQTQADQSFKLSWSHYVRLMAMKDNDERSFYEIECIENNWSLRELNRQFDSALYQRLALSKDKAGIKKLSEKGQVIEKTSDSLKEPYILEFLGIEDSHQYSESDLETAIINNLEKFLLELGKGFTFVARQQRITNGPDHYFIDLVFYNRLLQCFVLMDLKIGKIKHQDIGQMQMYTNYYDREVKIKKENPTIGIILCRENDHFVVKYSLPKEENQIFAKEYKLYLPKKEELEAEVKKLLD